MSNAAPYKKLEWDSQTFGIITGTVTRQDLDDATLRDVLQAMRAEGYRLVYFPAVRKMVGSDLLESFDGMLADEKVTYVKSLDTPFTYTPDDHIRSYDGATASPDLLRLAFDSGLYSRFRVDPHFTHDEYQVLYRIWIERSVRREIAHEVLVYAEGPNLLGMVTLGEKNDRGDIGLVAVSEDARGKGIGKKLMAAAEADFRKRGYGKIQVVTQGINQPAIKLYAGSGFSLDETVYFYHFWLS